MKETIKELTMQSLTRKQRLILLYFCVSFFTLSISDDSPIWLIVLVILNFANAARLVKKVPVK